MKTKIKKLDAFIRSKNYKPGVNLFVHLYLAVVLLNLKIPEVARCYKVPESKVEAALGFGSRYLLGSKKFHADMKSIYKSYTAQQELKFVA